MSTESDIVDALVATGAFAKVRYLVADSDPDSVPSVVPLAVLSDGGKNFAEFATMCGGGDVALETWFLNIYVASEAGATGLRTLLDTTRSALLGIAMIDDITESYDSELRAYTAELTLS